VLRSGRPVLDLEMHPFFLTVPVVKTVASDGTEIWNYVNGANLGNCYDSGSISSLGYINSAQYTEFSSCVARFAACNNIFYIRDGTVLRYSPIGTGGMRCMTNASLQPGFKGTVNLY
jgi:hypothetical protein